MSESPGQPLAMYVFSKGMSTTICAYPMLGLTPYLPLFQVSFKVLSMTQALERNQEQRQVWCQTKHWVYTSGSGHPFAEFKHN